VENGVATLRIDRPKMNALNEQLQEEIRALAGEAGQRDRNGDVKCVFPKSFADRRSGHACYAPRVLR